MVNLKWMASRFCKDKTEIEIRVLPAGETGVVSLPSRTLLILPTRKSSLPKQTLAAKFLLPYQRFIPLTKQQFSCYNPIKTSFLAVVIAHVPFFLTSYSLSKQVILINQIIYRMLLLVFKKVQMVKITLLLVLTTLKTIPQANFSFTSPPLFPTGGKPHLGRNPPTP